jgi:hypothetical protein
MPTLESLGFDNTYARLPEAFYRRVKPAPPPAPHLVSFNRAAADLIGLDPQEAERPEFAEYFGGNKLLPGGDPVSAIYAGHLTRTSSAASVILRPTRARATVTCATCLLSRGRSTIGRGSTTPG